MKRTGLNTVLVLSFMTVMACLSSCHPSEEVGVDTSLLTGDPCGPPCWQGLVPGVSTEQEVLQYMAESEYVGEYYRDTYAGSITIWWQSTLPGRSQSTSNAFGIRDGVLTDMLTYLDYELTLHELLQRYGPPERFWAQWRSGGSADALVNLYYPSQGFIPQLELKPSDGYHELQPQSTIVRVWYFPPTSLEGLLDLGGSVPFPRREYMDSELEDWHGYGRIRVT